MAWWDLALEDRGLALLEDCISRRSLESAIQEHRSSQSHFSAAVREHSQHVHQLRFSLGDVRTRLLAQTSEHKRDLHLLGASLERLSDDREARVALIVRTAELQRRALVIGVIGAIVLRVIMILIGAWLVAQFHWMLYLFGAFLLFTGVKMLVFADSKPDLNQNPLLKFIRKHVRLSNDFDGERFSVVRDGVRFFTPLFVVVVMIGITDVVFAVDSIPAIFAITEDPFIVMTSNIFAILGLRALYFLLADLASRFHLLSYGLALVLVFVGVKMLIVDWYKIPVFVSLGIVGAILAVSVLASWFTKPVDEKLAA
jgi:TerC family integral membrane protein